MNLAMQHVDLIAEAVETLRRHGEAELATALDQEVVAEFWDNYEPLPPVYDGPYEPARKGDL